MISSDRNLSVKSSVLETQKQEINLYDHVQYNCIISRLFLVDVTTTIGDESVECSVKMSKDSNSKEDKRALTMH